MYAIGRLELVPINTTHVHQTGNVALNMIMDVKLRQITVVAARRRRQVSSCLSCSDQIAFLCGNEEKTEHEKPIWMPVMSFFFFKRRVEDGTTLSTKIKFLIFLFFDGNIWWLSLKHWDKLKFQGRTKNEQQRWFKSKGFSLKVIWVEFLEKKKITRNRNKNGSLPILLVFLSIDSDEINTFVTKFIHLNIFFLIYFLLICYKVTTKPTPKPKTTPPHPPKNVCDWPVGTCTYKYDPCPPDWERCPQYDYGCKLATNHCCCRKKLPPGKLLSVN